MGTAAKPTRENRTITIDFQNETTTFSCWATAKHFSNVSWPFGSDLHVMLALRRSPRQVIVTNKQLNGADMVDELL